MLAAWVIDAFWDDRIPFPARKKGHFDHIFVTEQEVVGPWQATTGTPTSWLAFGADVLDMGSGATDRPVDLQRFGRMPPVGRRRSRRGRVAAVGLRFEGRPPFLRDARANQREVMARFARAKFTLSFTNRVSPAPSPIRHVNLRPAAGPTRWPQAPPWPGSHRTAPRPVNCSGRERRSTWGQSTGRKVQTGSARPWPSGARSAPAQLPSGFGAPGLALALPPTGGHQ